MTILYIEKNKKATFYYKDPKMKILHREEGPAAEWTNGDKMWFQNGQYHRLDGPAAEYVNDDKHWYQNGKRHRLDGPAVEYANGNKQYYYQDKYFPDIKTNEQWKRHLKWMKFE